MDTPLDPQYIDAIKGFEGYSPNSSWDYKQYSSGYGTKAQPGDDSIPADQRQQVYEQRLNDELTKAAAHVDSVNPNLPPGPRAALISLTYNAGPGWSNSGLGDLVRSGDLQGAQARLLEYNKAGGQVNPGLVNRRAQEASWFGNSSTATQPQVAQNNAPVSPAASPASLPASSAPIFPASAPTQPQQQQPEQAQQSYFSQVPAEQPSLQPIFYAPRRPVSLAALKSFRPYFGKS